MRFLISLFALSAAVALASACGDGGGRRTATNTATKNSNQSSKAETTLAHGPSSGSVPPVASGHGGASATAPASAGATAKPSLETPELDDRIQKAEAKAKASGASSADKKAAADAYLARANMYRDAGNPALYKFALGDYRRALRYDPANAEAKAKMDEIVSIYQGMGRPVPDNGNEP